MALPALTVFEVRPSGGGSSDNNGGGFVTGSTGTDYSLQDSPQVAFDGTTIKLSNSGISATVTVTGATVDGTWVGNLLNITGGTNFTVGNYHIQSTAAGTVTLDRNATTGAGAAGTGNMGGALASPGRAGQYMVAGNKMYVKAATYTVTSATANTNAGCMSLPGSSGTNTTFMQGYDQARGDFTGTRPIIKADGVITTFTLIASTVNVLNVELDGNSRTSSRGGSGNGAIWYNCVFRNFTNNGVTGNVATLVIDCLVMGCTTGTPVNSCSIYYTRMTANNNTPWVPPSNGVAVGCIADNNTGVSTDGFVTTSNTVFLNCTSYNNGRDNYRNTVNAGAMFINCIGFGTNGTSFNFTTTLAGSTGYTPLMPTLVNCAADSYSTNVTSLNKINSVTLSGDPFTSAATGDFSLNNTAGRGAACRAAGIPTTFTGGSTTAHVDIGAAQHGDPTQPLASHVLNDQTYNDGATTGTLTLPMASQVKNGISYGIGGTGLTGNVTLPATTDVASGVHYGASGTEFTGSLSASGGAGAVVLMV
jgi:hypothetical protein